MSKLYQAIAQNGARIGDEIALIEDGAQWTYRDFVAMIDQAAGGFRAMGVAPGDRVALMLFNNKEFLVSLYALRKIGAVVVPVNLQILPQDIIYVLMNAGARFVVLDEILLPKLAGNIPAKLIVLNSTDANGETTDVGGESTFNDLLAAGVDAPTDEVPTADDDLAFLIYTSGTTGYPKGVMLSEKNILANIEGFRDMLGFFDGDRLLLALPLFHAYGLMVAQVGLIAGGSIILIPKFHPKKIAEALFTGQPTILPMVPMLFNVLLDLVDKHGTADLPTLRFCVSGGASLPKPLLARIEQTLKTTVIEGYGMTETAPVLAANDPKVGSIPGSVGKPLENLEIRIADESGNILPTGEAGEIQARGANIMLGYYNLPEDSQNVLTPDGWLRTGDLGHFDEKGYLFISGGRIKDLIIKAGENIPPYPIEEALFHHPAVAEAAVIPMPDEKLGEDILACVSLKEGHTATPQEIQRFCREQLPSNYVPARVEILPELPKNPLGKVVKKLLRDQIPMAKG